MRDDQTDRQTDERDDNNRHSFEKGQINANKYRQTYLYYQNLAEQEHRVKEEYNNC